MNIMAAMEDTMIEAEACWKRYICGNTFKNLNEHMMLPHLRHMAMDMRRREMSATKKCRYLGWMQASIVSWGAGADLDTMKNINKAHRDNAPGDYQHARLYVYDATSQTFDPVPVTITTGPVQSLGPRKAIVVCLNDFPCGVFDTRELADKYIADQKKLFTGYVKNPSHMRHWHTHEYEINKGEHT